MNDITKPSDAFAQTRPQKIIDPIARFEMAAKRRKRNRRGLGCLMVILALALVLGIYFLSPGRTNILVLGIDRAPDNTNMSRSDTIMLVTVIPLKPYVGLLSIPRDLWIDVPGHGQNRINTVHFYAEIDHPGSGPAVAAQVISSLFKVPVNYTVRLRFDGVREIVNALGGVELDLPTAMGGLTAGKHYLNGDQALTFVRDRKGTDDFFRTNQQRVFIAAVIRKLRLPTTWVRLPAVLVAIDRTVDTNVPIWQWPRLTLALLRAGPKGIDAQGISREMTQPTVTSGGADVLLPLWDKINPLVDKMFR
jgi:polyisoprenyl-teichoic acid--peptidoglycan teichoic acid transferase